MVWTEINKANEVFAKGKNLICPCLMKIIIIGALGMLGQELVKIFFNDKLWSWDLPWIDITNKAQVTKKIFAIKPDIVINAAAYNDVEEAEDNRELAMKINGQGVGYLAQAINKNNGILVHFSTDYVFNGKNKKGYQENDQPDPISVYGWSKYLGEQELQKAANHFYLIRLSRLFGQPAKSQGAKVSFVEKMFDLAKIKTEIKVINEELSCPTYAPDLAQQTKFIIDSKLPFGIYHITNSGSCTWYELAKEIFTTKKIKIKLKPVASDFFFRLAKRPKFSILINTKLPPLRSWQEALKEYLSI